MKVMVVEDDRSILETLGMVLELYHHQADLVDNAEGVMTYLKSSWPDVMLLDLTLREMSGEEVFEKILSYFGKVPPTIVLSAVQNGEARARRLPGAWFLAKPYTIEDLAEMIEVAGGARGAA